MTKIITDESKSAVRFLDFTITSEELEKKMEVLAKNYQKRVKIQGFRPGKAPLELVKARFREDLLNDAIVEIVNQKTLEEVKLRKLNFIPPAKILRIEPGEDNSFKVKVQIDVIPNFEIPPLQNITVKRRIIRVSEQDVENKIEEYRRQLGEFVDKGGKVEPGDYVFVDYKEIDENGKVIDSLKNAYVVADPTKTPEVIVNELLDKKPGDRVTVSINVKDQEGKETKRTFKYHIRSIKRLVLPDVDEEFAQTLGFENREKMYESIRAELEERVREHADRALEDEIIKEIYDRIQFEVPENLVERYQRFFRDAVKAKGAKNLDELEETINTLAVRRAIRDIILDRFSESRSIEPTEEEINEEIKKLAKEYNVDPKEYRRRVEERGVMDGLITDLRREKAMEHLKNLVKLEVVVE